MTCCLNGLMRDSLPLIVEDIISKHPDVFVRFLLANLGDDTIRCCRLDLLFQASDFLVPVCPHGLVEDRAEHAGSRPQTPRFKALLPLLKLVLYPVRHRGWES